MRKRSCRDIAAAKRRSIRKTLIKRHGCTCAYCGKEFRPEDLTMDHIIPLSKGGSLSSITNIVLACDPCNQKKGDKTVRPVFYLFWNQIEGACK